MEDLSKQPTKQLEGAEYVALQIDRSGLPKRLGVIPLALGFSSGRCLMGYSIYKLSRNFTDSKGEFFN